MKKMVRKALLGMITVGVLAGCASEEDTIVMAPLPQVNSQSLRNQLGVPVSVMV